MHRIFTSVAAAYPRYVKKVERKGRTKAELDELPSGKAMEKVLRA